MTPKNEKETLEKLLKNYKGERVMITMAEDWVAVSIEGENTARMYKFDKKIDA